MKRLLLLVLFLGFIQTSKAGIEIQQITVTPINTTDINIHTTVVDGYYFEYLNHTYDVTNNTITLNICYSPFLTPVGTTKENDFIIPNINSGVTDFTLIVNVNKRMWTGSFWTCDNVSDTDSATLAFSTPLDGPVNLSTSGFAFEADGLEMYPNPTSGVVSFNSKESIKNVEVFDNLGRKIKAFNTFSNNSINLSNLDDGVYFVTISSENGSLSGKIILKK